MQPNVWKLFQHAAKLPLPWCFVISVLCGGVSPLLFPNSRRLFLLAFFVMLIQENAMPFWSCTPTERINASVFGEVVFENFLDFHADYLLWPSWLYFPFSACAGWHSYVCVCTKQCRAVGCTLKNVLFFFKLLLKVNNKYEFITLHDRQGLKPAQTFVCNIQDLEVSAAHFVAATCAETLVVCWNHHVCLCVLGPFTEWKLYLGRRRWLLMEALCMGAIKWLLVSGVCSLEGLLILEAPWSHRRKTSYIC